MTLSQYMNTPIFSGTELTPRMLERFDWDYIRCLRARMTRHRVSPSQLADQMGVDRTRVSRWLNGHVDPGANQVCYMEQALQELRPGRKKEREGLEPSMPCATSVIETAAISRIPAPLHVRGRSSVRRQARRRGYQVLMPADERRDVRLRVISRVA